jgi:protein ImuB
LTALSKADIAQRLGTEGVALWERAAGETTSVLRLVEPSQTFEAEWEYEPPVESIEPLFFRLRAFAERIALELRAAQLVAEELTLTLFLEDETDYRRNFRLLEANTDLDSWLRVLNSHLETVRTAARVVRVRLVAKPSRAPEKQGGLFDTGLRDPAAFWENLARVSAIVGEGRVGTPIIADTHKPDAFILVKPTELVPAPAEPPIHPSRGLRLRRFRPPWPIHVELAGQRPTTIDSAQIRGAVCAVAGPWRVSGEWWRPQAWAVETWHVELSEGGVYQLAHTDDGWRIEGVLD